MNAKAWSLALIIGACSALGLPSWGAEVQEPLKLALELHDASKFAEAIAEYDKVIKTHPKMAEAY
ncbi:MAG TPA: hypothetical protein VKH62_12055, partial [Candidatus Binatia bacterium]|nr:hypothetical protein [Candidatus Binatia bacterium]